MCHSLLVFLSCFIICVYSVDRSNFKTCDESGFCKRQRNYQVEQSPYAVVLETVTINPTRFSAIVINTASKAQWTLDVIKLAHQTFRVMMDELNAPRARYKIPTGDTLPTEPVEETMTVTQSKEVLPNGETRILYYFKGENEHNERAVLQVRPLRFDFYLGDKLLVALNGQGLLNLEEQRQRQAQQEPETSPNFEGSETTSTPAPAPSEELPGAWEETFKSHTDKKPYGPMSIGVDVLFPGFKYVYGIPTHADDLWLKDTTSGDPYRLYNLDVFEYELQTKMALYGHIPLLWAVNSNYTAGVLWHNPSETWVDIKHAGSWAVLSNMLRTFSPSFQSETLNNGVQTHWFSETGVMDVFIILANNPREALSAYGRLTGVTPLPPLFSLAYHQCRWNYNDAQDVVTVDSNFDVYDIPYDVIWLDIEHTDGKRYFTWDRTRFPDPDALVNVLEAKGRKLVTVIDPHVKRDDNWNFYKEALNQQLFIKNSDGQGVYEGWCWPGSSSWLDFVSPTVRRWWAEQYLTYAGSRPDNTFSWNDMGEPSVFNGPEVTMHKDAIHLDNREHREVHNIYGMHAHRASWEGQLLRSSNLERPFVLTRAFFIGSQRYGAVWTGDNAARWDHLKASIPMLLSLSVCGITFVGADVGGFFGNPDVELLTRWYQAGAYQPFFRAHAHLDTKRREPWLFPKENTLLIREAIRQRYQLLPYWYTQFYLAESSGAPIMAPLWYYFPNEEDSYTLEDQYMIGPALLVKPVTDAGATHINVYLPSGRWYIQHTWEPFEGGHWHGLNVNEHSIPVFYRGGQIIPRRDRIRRSSSLMDRDPFSLIVAVDPLTGNSSGDLYVDDGHSYKYRDSNEYVHVKFHFSTVDNKLRIERVANGTATNKAPTAFTDLSIERVVILGLIRKPIRAWVLKPNSAPQPVISSYVSEPQLLVIRKPGVQLGDHWTIQLQMDDTQKVEL